MDGPRPGLSVCLIVRDEERSLPRALGSVASIADEICVLDTGSRDRTVEVARGLGARVGAFTWCDDFAAARNASIAMARHEWILVLDADEAVAPESLGALRTAVAADRLAWLVAREDLRPSGAPDVILLARLFRNDPRIRFSRPVHEDISDSLFSVGVRQLDESGVRLLHYGYLPEVLAERDKLARNVAILRQRVLAAPDDLFSLYKLAQSLERAEQAAERLTALHAAFEAAERLPDEAREELPYLPEIYDGYASALVRGGALARAVAVAERGLAHFPDRQELLLRRGDLAHRAGDFAAAQAQYRATLGRCRVSALRDQSEALTVRALLGLTSVALATGAVEDAVRVVGRAQLLAPTAPAVQRLDTEVLLATRQFAAAARRLAGLLEAGPHDREVRVLGGRLAWATRAPDVAGELWRSALGPDEPGDLARLWLWIAEAALGSGLEEVSVLRQIVPRDTRTAAAQAIADALSTPGAPLDAGFVTAAVERAAVSLLGELGRYGRVLHIDAAALAAPEPEPRGLSSLFPPDAAE